MAANPIPEVTRDLILLADLLSMHDPDHPKYNRADILRDVMTETARNLRKHAATLTAAQQQEQQGQAVGYIVHSADEATRVELTQEAMVLGLGKHAVYTAPQHQEPKP
jgi:DNA-directed RNA polymerase beta' subunit